MSKCRNVEISCTVNDSSHPYGEKEHDKYQSDTGTCDMFPTRECSVVLVWLEFDRGGGCAVIDGVDHVVG